MASLQTHNLLGVTDKRTGSGSGASPIATIGNYGDITAMRARLTAISSSTYTTAVLNSMTVNDMLYAIRLNDDAAGF